MACVVHGDDFVFEGDVVALDVLPDQLREFWLIKKRGLLGPESGDDKEVSILNRVLRWTDRGVEYEADPRHVEKLLRDMGMIDCKPLSTPAVRPSAGEVDELSQAEQTLFRGGGGGGPVQLLECGPPRDYLCHQGVVSLYV